MKEELEVPKSVCLPVYVHGRDFCYLLLFYSVSVGNSMDEIATFLLENLFTAQFSLPALVYSLKPLPLNGQKWDKYVSILRWQKKSLRRFEKLIYLTHIFKMLLNIKKSYWISKLGVFHRKLRMETQMYRKRWCWKIK